MRAMLPAAHQQTPQTAVVGSRPQFSDDFQ